MDTLFEDTVRRIRTLRVYDLSLTEIHDKIAPEVGEELFFLAYVASSF